LGIGALITVKDLLKAAFYFFDNKGLLELQIVDLQFTIHILKIF